MLALQAAFNRAADVAERLAQISTWADPMWCLVAVLVVLACAFFIALAGIEPFLGLLLLLKLRPPWMKSKSSPNAVAMLLRRLPLSSER
jgi:hypothetical protein